MGVLSGGHDGTCDRGMASEEGGLSDRRRVCRRLADFSRGYFERRELPDQLMNVIVVGLSHKTAPVKLRELLMVPDSRIGEAVKRLMAHPSIHEGVFLQTCNRVEVYAVTDHADDGFSGVQEFLVDTHLSLSAEQLLPHLYWHAGDRAITHLFRVASSLDSLVVGEPQILGQVKECFMDASTHDASGVILNKVFQKAIAVAKRVRTETRIAENAVSVSYAAV